MRVLLLSVLLVSGCSGSGRPGDDPKDTGKPPGTYEPPQAEICAQWLECVAAIDPDRVADEEARYGKEGDCWTDTSSASVCAGECKSSLEEAFFENPLVEVCDTGKRYPLDEILSSGENWVIESVTSEPCDDLPPSRLYRAEGQLNFIRGNEFRFDFDKALVFGEGVGLYFEEGGGNAKCTFEFPHFVCDGLLDGPVGEGYEWAMTMQGAFEPPFDTLLGQMQIYLEGRCWIDTVVVGFIP